MAGYGNDALEADCQSHMKGMQADGNSICYGAGYQGTGDFANVTIARTVIQEDSRDGVDDECRIGQGL